MFVMIDFLSALEVLVDPVVPPAPAAPPNLDWLGPVVTSIGGILVAAVGGVSLVWRRRQERQDALQDQRTDAELATQPKITDGWEEVRQARLEATRYYNLYRTFENLYYTAFAALRRVVRDTRTAHPEQQFGQDVLDALALVPPDTSDGK